MFGSRLRASRPSNNANRASCGRDSEVNIGLHKQSLDHQGFNNFTGKMSPLAFHKLQTTSLTRAEPTPSTKCGAPNGEYTDATRN